MAIWTRSRIIDEADRPWSIARRLSSCQSVGDGKQPIIKRYFELGVLDFSGRFPGVASLGDSRFRIAWRDDLSSNSGHSHLPVLRRNRRHPELPGLAAPHRK